MRSKLFKLVKQLRLLAEKEDIAECYNSAEGGMVADEARHEGQAAGLRLAKSMLLEVLMEERREQYGAVAFVEKSTAADVSNGTLAGKRTAVDGVIYGGQ